MKACILVMGVPASGKSTVARALSERLGIPVFSKDDMKETLYDTIGFRSRAEKVALGNAAMELLYDTARRMMARGLPLILENNFENASRPGLEALLRGSGYTPIAVRLTGEWDAIYERFVERDRSGLRHPGHVVNDCYPVRPGSGQPETQLSRTEFERSIHARGMDTFDVGGPTLCVDTTQWTQVDIDAIAAWVKARMEAGAQDAET